MIIFCIPFLDFWFEQEVTVTVNKVMAVDLVRCKQIQNAFLIVRVAIGVVMGGKEESRLTPRYQLY